LGTRLFIFIIFIFSFPGCHQPGPAVSDRADKSPNDKQPTTVDSSHKASEGALLLTRFKSVQDFESIVKVQYYGDTSNFGRAIGHAPLVILSYQDGNHEITSLLKSGISQADFNVAKNGTFWNRATLALRCPYALFNRKDLACIENLGRRKPETFGIGDAAFYDLAEIMVQHIIKEDRTLMSEADLSEKGYLNTFNHITAQAFMTSIFSERTADFVADVHELYNMTQLISGNFTQRQLADFENGPVDNYIDMLNNEWGQELGKVLRKKYSIGRQTVWTPGLLTQYLNDNQSYYSWVFQIGFTPFRDTDDKVIRFASKINRVLAN
jgi:hypothetical protein